MSICDENNKPWIFIADLKVNLLVMEDYFYSLSKNYNVKIIKNRKRNNPKRIISI